VWNLYHAHYWLAGMTKAFTALASMVTAVLLVRVGPAALRLPSPNDVRRTNDALRDSEERYRTLVETAPEMILTLDLQGRFTSFNAAFQTLTGWPSAEWLGRHFTDLVHPDDASACLTVFDAAARDETPPSVTQRVRTRRGEWLTLESTATPQRLEGRVAAVLGVARDVSARVRAAEVIVESQARLRALFDNALDAILVIDDKGRYVDANPAAVGLLGYTRDELLSLAIGDLTPVEDRWRFPDGWRAFLEQGTYAGEYRMLRKDGIVLDTEFHGVANFLPGLHLGMLRDITARKRMEEEREALSRRLVQLQEEERGAISRELHDEVGQLLTGLRLMIEHSDAIGAADQSEEIKRVVNEVIGRVRDLSMSLRPPMLDALGVLPTLLWQIERFEKQASLVVDFHHAHLDRRFPPEIELTVVRVVQEALTNVAKHADVRKVRVEVWANEQTLGARIGDEGRGFDAGAALGAPSSGLSGIRERCRLLRGRLSIASTPGAGTRLLVELPLAEVTKTGIV
jgi:PAS domain S-box-containing protein